MSDSKHNLFDDFQSVSAKQWKQQIQFELKGADYNETLIWESPEGIKVKPFYHRDEFETDFVGTESSEPFKICQDIFVFDVDKSVTRALDSMNRGAESIRFTIEDRATDIKKLLANLPLENITIYLQLSFIDRELILEVEKIAAEKSAKIFCLIDPVGHLAADGNWFPSKGKNNFEDLNSLSANLRHVGIISVNGNLYQNAGANMVQQIAYTLAHANEYLIRIENITQPIVLKMAVGTNYFFEIAKLRATRLLFDLIAKEYNYQNHCHLFVSPTKRNKTLYDYNVNMLRSTTECMSAILGGADTISNIPYDALYHKSNEFGERISRNQLLILKNESYFDKVTNAADGSYYIESLTQQLAEKALVLFKDIEANGGFLKQLGDLTIQRKIAESAEKEQALFDSGKEVLLGTNKHPNKNDRMANDLELFPFVKVKPRKTLITPIVEKRLAEKQEQIRLESEKTAL